MLDGVSCYENPKISMTILLLLGMLMTSDFCYTSNANWRRQSHPTPVLLLGKSHGWRSLVSCGRSTGSLSRTRLNDFNFTFHFHALEKEMATHSSVLASRIPGVGGAWWVAVYGIAQSQTRLKWLSSSSSSNATNATVSFRHRLHVCSV